MTTRHFPSGLVRKIVVRDIGLAEDEALRWRIEWRPCASSITTRPTAGGPSRPMSRAGLAAGDSSAEVVKLAEEGIRSL